jgi:DnaA family protein
VADDVDALDEPAQIALFNAINRAREGRGAVLAAGNAPPGQLALREDLRSRLGWGLVYQLKALTDEDKARHLRAEAERRGLRLADEVIWYLLNRLPRDLPSLNAALELLDRYSLSQQRHITLPLVREALKADAK